ncbi:Lipase 2 [Zancudomyces culisetae]|uniref:Lipase 2 n=1 Tax=Zancudomyces culisetae TaxID=1213189 RepID=A0A1R1PIB9_ZANCU|nr:Lipase 2 [Zancudomyces culisetae]|eukprot:OMH80653.1 Lipase 2 [Zancudomyces culisetae]
MLMLNGGIYAEYENEGVSKRLKSIESSNSSEAKSGDTESKTSTKSRNAKKQAREASAGRIEAPLRPIYIAPRNPIVLCHGLYGFDVRGPTSMPLLQIHYWTGIKEQLQKLGAKVVVSRVSGTGGIRRRAFELHESIQKQLKNRADFFDSSGDPCVNLVGHSMGGLDGRYLITHVLPKVDSIYSVGSLTTVSTPHHGSPFMDWCQKYLGLGNIFEDEFLCQGTRPGNTERRIDEEISNTIHSMVDPQNSSGFEFARLQGRYRGGSGVGVGVGGEKTNSMFRNIDKNDAKLEQFVDSLNSFMGNDIWRLSAEGNVDLPLMNSKSKNISASEDKDISKVGPKFSSLKSAGLHWGAVGGSYLSQSVVLMKQLISRLIMMADTPAYACLTTDFCNRVFNPNTPDADHVKYYSYGAKIDPSLASSRLFFTSLLFPHSVVYNADGDNDGFVSVKSATYGKYLGTLTCGHFDLTNKNRLTGTYRYLSKNMPRAGFLGSIFSEGKNPSLDFDPVEFYLQLATRLYNYGF